MTEKVANTLADEPVGQQELKVDDDASNVANDDALPEFKKQRKQSKFTLKTKLLFCVSLLLIGVTVYANNVLLPAYKASKDFHKAANVDESLDNDSNTSVDSVDSVDVLPTLDNDVFNVNEPELNQVVNTFAVDSEEITSQFERQSNALRSLSDGIGQGFKQVTNTIVNSVNTQRSASSVITDNQRDLFDIVNSLNESINDLNNTLKGVNRNTSKVLQEIEDMKLVMINSSQAFPVVVYSKGRWGDQEYITIAPKDYPTQTKNLRVNESAGDWTLIEILNREVVFKHFNGKTKRVGL